jgi:hypothetical protein
VLLSLLDVELEGDRARIPSQGNSHSPPTLNQANYISFPIAAAVAPEVRLYPDSREYDVVTYELPTSWWQPLSDHLTLHTASSAIVLEEPGTDTALQ